MKSFHKELTPLFSLLRVRIVNCPRCLAKPGYICDTRSGKNHYDRVLKYYFANLSGNLDNLGNRC